MDQTRPPQHVLHNRLLKRLNISERFGLCYVNNPKVASSTIKLCLQRAECGDPTYIPKAGVHRRYASPLRTWPEVRGLNLAELQTHYFVFSFVRNPFDRLRSVYINKILCPRSKGRFRQCAGFDPEYTPSFGEFITAITDQDLKCADPHWQPQHINLACDEIRYDMIGKLENFARDWKTLAAPKGLPLSPSRLGRQTTTRPRPEIVWTDPLIRRVLWAYALDFRLFGYAYSPGCRTFSGVSSWAS